MGGLCTPTLCVNIRVKKFCIAGRIRRYFFDFHENECTRPAKGQEKTFQIRKKNTE